MTKEEALEPASKVVNEYGKIIVVEDDLITSPYFLEYMNHALDMYEHDEDVVCIHGYNYPIENMPETFFIRGADCWGWATWKRGWAIFNPDSKYLLDKIMEKHLEKDFNFNNTYDYVGMLKNQIEGKVSSWAVRWLASSFLENKLCLYPGRSLVLNIGVDGSGTHCGNSEDFTSDLNKERFLPSKISIEENLDVRKKWENYFRGIRSMGDFVFNIFGIKIRFKKIKIFGYEKNKNYNILYIFGIKITFKKNIQNEEYG